MTTRSLRLFFSFVLLTSCVKESFICPNATREAIISSYLEAYDSLPQPYEYDEKFELLKAYHANDTNQLREAYDRLRHKLHLVRQRQDTAELCEFPLPLAQVGFEEAYRFRYFASFCDTLIVMTIGRRETEFTAEILLYRLGIFNDRCVMNRIEKKLDERSWKLLTDGLRYADFWGMGAFNDRDGLDGSQLDIYGYDSRLTPSGHPKQKSVYRWSPEKTAIGRVFKDMIDATGSNVTCFHYNDPPPGKQESE